MDPDQRIIDYVRAIGEVIDTPDGQVSASQMLGMVLDSIRRGHNGSRSANAPAARNAGSVYWES